MRAILERVMVLLELICNSDDHLVDGTIGKLRSMTLDVVDLDVA